MLRQIGYRSVANRSISFPSSSRFLLSKSFTSAIVLIKVGIGPISFRDHCDRFRPINLECRIIEAYSSSVPGIVIFRHLIKDFGFVFQGKKTVCASFRYVHHFPVFGGENYSNPLLESRRVRTKVEYNIVDRTPGATNEFGLAMRRNLVMHATQRCSSRAERYAALH